MYNLILENRPSMHINFVFQELVIECTVLLSYNKIMSDII